MSPNAKVISNEGRPTYKYSAWFRACMILIVEMMERLCYYSISDLVNPLLLGYLNFQHDSAKQIKLAFTGVGYASALLWGYLADRYIGRKAVIKWTVPFCKLSPHVSMHS